MNRFALALAVLGLPSAANSAIIVQQTAVPTVGVDGSQTWTITLESDDPNEIIFGVDAKFAGPMGQIRGGPLATTPFIDFYFILTYIGPDPTQDSHFLFQSIALSPPALNVTDTADMLTAAITNLPNATGGDGAAIELAQIAKLDLDTVVYDFELDVRTPTGQAIRSESLTGVVGIPEPATAGLAIAAIACILGRRRRH